MYTQLSSRQQVVGEETPAAYVHPAQETTATEQAPGSALERPSSQHHRSSSSLSDVLPMQDEVITSHLLQQCDPWISWSPETA